MASGVGVTVYADGVRIADGAPADPDTAPTALSGLAITWGRASTVDQPEASTCALDVMDLPGGVALDDVLGTGTAITVTATGITYPDPSVSTWPDPGFEVAAPNVATATGATVTRSTRRAQAGTHSARLTPSNTADAGRTMTVVLAPAPFSAPGTNPDAWDAIPATALGQRWGISVRVYAPLGASVRLRPVLFTGPYAATYHVLSDTVLSTGSATWATMSATFTPDVAGAWVGVQVTVYPTGRTWDAMPGTWDALDPALTWDDTADTYLDTVTVTAPSGGVSSTVLVFAGRVSDLSAAWDDAIGAPVYKLTAVDFTADLSNRDVGDTPWLAESMGVRFSRILTLSGLDVSATVAASVSGVQVSWRDVDRQPAGGLLSTLSSDVDAVMWSATHQVTGPYLLVEDQAKRPPATVLELSGGVVRIVQSAADALALSACDVLRDPVVFAQAVADVVTRVSVGWLEQGTDGGTPITIERVYDLVAPDRESADGFGVRRYAIATQLTSEAAAAKVATQILNRGASGWRAGGLTLDDGLPADVDDIAAQTTRLLTLLDGTSRNGLALRLDELPTWSPGAPSIGVYLEGGQYRFEDGHWVLELIASNSAGSGSSVTWDELPAGWQWDQFDPSITWDALAGVGIEA